MSHFCINMCSNLIFLSLTEFSGPVVLSDGPEGDAVWVFLCGKSVDVFRIAYVCYEADLSCLLNGLFHVEIQLVRL